MPGHLNDMFDGLTWRGGPIDDAELLADLPADLVHLLGELNGFILDEGALHVRGASLAPEWHSLRAAWKGPNALHRLYEELEPGDVPFAQDQLGDQFLLRQGMVIRLSAETGAVEPFAECLEDFLEELEEDIEELLDVGLDHALEPGELLLANPPFCFQESEAGVRLDPKPAADVIRRHAELAKRIRGVPEGAEIDFNMGTD